VSIEGGARAVGYGSINAGMSADERRELGEALVRVTRERDSLLKQVQGVRTLIDQRDEALEEVDRITAERDDARKQVVELGRQNEEITEERDHARSEWHRMAELYRAERNARWAGGREIERLRTIIGELGAAEAAEPPEGQRCPRCGETRELSEKWGVCQPCVIDERWEDVAAAQPPEGIEALRPGGAE